MTKTKAAFLLSVRRLFEQRRRVYLWTFTTRSVVDDKIAFASWNHLNTLLRREFLDTIGMPGIRVVEVHPGNGFVPGGHGLHFHVLIARRLPVAVVRRLAIRAGFGRIHVKRAKAGHGEYLAKYLGKQDDGLRRGTRRWGMFGNFKGTLVRNIEVCSTLAENCRSVKEALGVWGYSLYVAVRQMTVKHGHVLEWPEYAKMSERVPCPTNRSDNDELLPDGCDRNGRKARFDWVTVFQEEISEWCRVLVPALRTAEPF